MNALSSSPFIKNLLLSSFYFIFQHLKNYGFWNFRLENYWVHFGNSSIINVLLLWYITSVKCTIVVFFWRCSYSSTVYSIISIEKKFPPNINSIIWTFSLLYQIRINKENVQKWAYVCVFLENECFLEIYALYQIPLISTTFSVH